MCFGLITAGLGIAQQVMGMVGQAKGAKQEAAPKEEAKGAEEGGAPKEAAKEKEQANPIDRFMEMLNGANSIEDMKKVRDQALEAVKPEQRENAERKLNQAILKKLGLGEPGANGDLQVPLTPQTQQILQQLGMKPDEVKQPGGGAPKPAVM
jgi:hypothetical protein